MIEVGDIVIPNIYINISSKLDRMVDVESVGCEVISTHSGFVIVRQLYNYREVAYLDSEVTVDVGLTRNNRLKRIVGDDTI